jgi:hypothetical protein
VSYDPKLGIQEEDPQDPEDEDGGSGINRGVLIGSMGVLAALVLGGFVYLLGTFRNVAEYDWFEKVIGCPFVTILMEQLNFYIFLL